jgi:septum formation protein
MSLILASGSSARKAMLTAAGLAFSVRPAGIDERSIEIPLLAGGASPADVAAALAEEKALAVSRAAAGALVVGADQTLDLDGERWTKPATLSAAREQLARLSGRSHRLHSAVATARDGRVLWQHTASATLTMRTLSDAAIDAYLAETGERALTSVGAYELEGRGVRLFEAIDGDYFTILGLPLLPLLAYLRGEGEIGW